MSVVNSSTIVIKNAEAEAFNLGSVTQAPRSATSLDLQAASGNLLFEPSNKVSDLVLAAAKFVLTDYFIQAHQSGLYNRQIKLWEALAKIAVVDVKQLSRGIFQKVALPVYELNFKTSAGQILVSALVVEPLFSKTVQNEKNSHAQLDLFKEFLGRVAKMQARHGDQVRGVFLFFDSPFPPAVLTYVEKATGASDPVAKFDSILPAPYNTHVNLVVKLQGSPKADREPEVDPADQTDAEKDLKDQASKPLEMGGQMFLLHPQLRRPKRVADASSTNKVQIIYKY